MIPWRFIAIIFVFTLFVTFIGVNLENEAKINYFFGEGAAVTTNIVFVVFFSFLLGVFVTLPLVFKRKILYYHKPIKAEKDKKKKEKVQKTKKEKQPKTVAEESNENL